MRRLVIIGVAAAVFLLGATYLNLRYPPDRPTFMMVGSEHVAAGRSTTVRVLARLVDARSRLDAEVLSVQVDDHVVPFEAEGTRPVTVAFEVPGALRGREVTLAVTARAGGREAVLRAKVGLIKTDPESSPLSAVPPTLPATKRRFRLDLVPEGAGLIARLHNHIYLRVRDAFGAPVEGARVTVTHQALPGGAHVSVTDASGLTSFDLRADRPSYRFALQVVKGDAEATFERTIVPAGRQLLLRTDKPAMAPGDKSEIRFVTKKDSPTVYCDLRHGPVSLWSGTLIDVDEQTRLPVGPLAPGRYDVQCYFHPHTPGRTWATIPLLVGEGGVREQLTAEVQREGLMHDEALPLSPETRREVAIGYLTALLNEPPVMPAKLANLRNADVAARDEEFEAAKTNVLIALGGVFLLVLLLVADLILGNILGTRDRMRAFGAELAADEEAGASVEDLAALEDLTLMAHKSREGLVKTRGVMLVVLVGGTLVANIIAFIALMALVR